MAEARFQASRFQASRRAERTSFEGERAIDADFERAIDANFWCAHFAGIVSQLSPPASASSRRRCLARSALFPFPKFRSLADSRSRSNGPPRNPFTYMSVIAKTSSSTAASSKTL